MEPQTPGPDHLPPPSVAPAASSAPAAVEPKVETEPEEINAFNDEQLTRLQLQVENCADRNFTKINVLLKI